MTPLLSGKLPASTGTLPRNAAETPLGIAGTEIRFRGELILAIDAYFAHERPGQSEAESSDPCKRRRRGLPRGPELGDPFSEIMPAVGGDR